MRLLQWVLKKLFQREQSPDKEIEFQSMGVSFPFCLAAILFLGFQVLVASAGALDLIWPDLPAPVPFEKGRAVHLNFSIYWPLLGTMGATYYFFQLEAGKELIRAYMARILFWIFLFVGVGILISLALGYTEGREYLEAIRPFDWGIALATALFATSLIINYFAKGTPKQRPAIIGMTLGAVSLVALFIPNIFFYVHPSVDEIVKFWVVHLWEEMSLELLGTSITAAFLLRVNERSRRQVERILYLDLGFIFLTGFLATGHHYYWIGTPEYWLWVGGIFSTIQVLPIFLLLYTTYKGLKSDGFALFDQAAKLGMGFLLSSIFYHFWGAGLLGLTMALPPINRYVHGTYLTSAHAHFALFGVFGFLSLGFCVYILVYHFRVGARDLTILWASLLLLNLGLLIMGLALSIAGFLEAYLLRMAGVEFMEVQAVLTPYLTIRLFGGAIFALGGLSLAWTMLKLGWKNRGKIIGAKLE